MKIYVVTFYSPSEDRTSNIIAFKNRWEAVQYLEKDEKSYYLNIEELELAEDFSADKTDEQT